MNDLVTENQLIASFLLLIAAALVRQIKGQSRVNQGNQGNQGNQRNQSNEKKEGVIRNDLGGLMEYDPMGMGGFSDSFSSLDNPDSFLGHSFSLLGSNDQMIRPPSDEEFGSKKSNSDDEMKRKIEQLQAARDRDVKQPPQRIA